MKESSYDHLKPIHRVANSNQASNHSGVKMVVFSSGHVSQTPGTCEEKLLDCNGSIQEVQVRLTLDEGKTKSEIQKLKDSIQQKEYVIEELTEKLAATTLNDSCKESKIAEQNDQLEEQSEMLVKKSKQIEFLEKQVSEVIHSAEKTEDKLRSSLLQMKVENSELRTKIQSKNNYIDDLQTKLKELEDAMVTKVQTNNQLELERKDLDKTSSLLEAKITALENEIIVKDQICKQLDEEKKHLRLKMKEVKSRRNKQVKNLQDKINQKAVELAKSAENINELKVQRESDLKNDKSLNNLLLELRTEIEQKTEEKDHMMAKFAMIEKDRESLKCLNDKINEDLKNTKTQLEAEIDANKNLSANLESSKAKLRLLQQSYQSLMSTQVNSQSTIQEPTKKIDDIIIVDHFKIKLTISDLNRLRGLSWLNDKIINFYLEMIMARSAQYHNLPKCYAMNTFFMGKLQKDGYPAVKRWTKKVDIFSFDKIFIPFNSNDVHWCLAVVDMKEKGIYVYDSFGGDHDQVLKILLQYLKKEHMEKKGTIDIGKFTLRNVKGIALQANGSDCGIFTLKNAEYLSRNAKITFNQEDIPNMRRVMIYEILSMTIIYQ